jgi:hypothetical protein
MHLSHLGIPFFEYFVLSLHRGQAKTGLDICKRSRKAINSLADISQAG